MRTAEMVDLLKAPHDLDAEYATLGALLLQGAAAVKEVAATLRPEDFYKDGHGVIFATMLRLQRAGRAVDLITVANELRTSGEITLVGGDAVLALLMEHGSIAAHLPAYVGIVNDAAVKRRVAGFGSALSRDACNGTALSALLDRAQADLTEIVHRAEPADAAPLTIGLSTFLADLDVDPTPEPYIDGVLSSDGAGWLAGEEKVGKSLYMGEEALCLALAMPVCGRFPVPERRRVMVLGEEDSARRTRLRIRAHLRGHDLDPDDDRLDLDTWFRIACWTGLCLDDRAWLDRLEAEVVAFRPAVLYVDALRRVTHRDLNKADQAGALLADLDRLRRTYGVLPRIVHHSRKITAGGFRTGRGSQEMAGSYVLGAWGESSLFFEPIGRQQGAVRVTVQQKDGAPVPPFRLIIESEGPKHAPTVLRLRAEDDRGDDADDLVLQAIATLPTTPAIFKEPGVTIQQLADHLKRSVKTIRRAVGRLEDAGRIVVTGKASKQKDLYGVAAQ